MLLAARLAHAWRPCVRLSSTAAARVLPVQDFASLCAGQSVTLRGFVSRARLQKRVAFVDVRDGRGNTMQCVFDPQKTPLPRLVAGCSVAVDGVVKASEGAHQSLEVSGSAVRVLGDVDASYPLQGHTLSAVHLRDVPHMRPRTAPFAAALRVRSAAAHAVNDFFRAHDFTLVHTPILTGSDCEGAGEMFRVSAALNAAADQQQRTLRPDEQLLGTDASLTVSGQLHGEAAAFGVERIYTFGPTFRADRSESPRHLCEFWMIEPEWLFADVVDTMNLAEAFVRSVVDQVWCTHAADIERAYAATAARGTDADAAPGAGKRTEVERDQLLAQQPYARMTYTEAVAMLERSGRTFEYPVRWGLSLQSEHERYLCAQVGGPLFVSHYPATVAPFYARLTDADQLASADRQTVSTFDLLVPRIGELIGGGQREERLDVLERRMVAAGLALDKYSWYADLRRYGSVVHSGFGLGFERLLLLLTGLDNVRDVTLVPRAPSMCRL